VPDLGESARNGDRLATLRVLRDRLAVEIDGSASSRDVAALSQRLMDVLSQIDVIERAQPDAKGTPLDEVAKRRSQRKAASTNQGRAARGRK